MRSERRAVLSAEIFSIYHWSHYLNQNFRVKNSREVWVSDITYIRTGQGWLYLTIVIDLFDRKVNDTIDGIAHTHYDDLLSVFSPDDLMAMTTAKAGQIDHSITE
ncbi:hypothetical protein GCM10022217_25420 [Chryseobacterium ginsenosidimutans]|uniref:hypothetical protein n=1 Tax=Chryseobacterium ginsenosidimutans TaxID=687846 RepID=UPI0031D7FB1F